LSDDLKNPMGGPKLPGSLPGLGGKLGGAPLPGMAKPGALPGLGKQGLAGLPGFGAQKSVVPPYMQPGGAAPEPGPRKPPAEQVRRDPFASSGPSAPVPGFEQPMAEIVASVDERPAGVPAVRAKMVPKTRNMMLGVGAALVLIGFGAGSIVAGRVEDAAMIRDARIAKIELEKLGATFTIVDEAITSASRDAQAGKFNKEHMKILGEKLQGNPFNPTLFTDRNYKNFDPATITALNNYYDQWSELYVSLGSHFRKTENDEPELGASDAEFAKADPAHYGVVFARNEESSAILANLVVLGKRETKDGQLMTRVQNEIGTYGDERALYNGKAGDEEFAKNPEGFVIEVAPQTDADLLKDAAKPHFAQYQTRLKKMADLVASMREAQATVKTAVDKIAAESPPMLLTGISVSSDVEAYQKASIEAAAGAAAAAEKAKE
jgi:hypothetical protein